jgi:arylsulfatase A-like enzyme
VNIIGIMLDSFRQDHIGFYHGGRPAFQAVPACQTPNLDAFAQECIVFDNAYPEALPTIPVRTQLFTGQATLPFRPWQPLAQEDISIADILRAEGYVCGLISDCYHYRAPGMNFHRGFHAYRWIRGQEYDPWTSHPTRRNVDDYVNDHYDAVWRGRVAQFLANTDDFATEDDWFAAKVVDDAVDWLARNRTHPRVLAWIDSFDPHEPWDPPPRFDAYTDPAYGGKRLILPMGGLMQSWATKQEIRHIRGLYAGETAFVDHCLGRLFQALKDLGYYDDSVIVLLADHGHPLGDHDKFLKGEDRLFNELLKVPFMIRLPGGEGAPHSGDRPVSRPASDLVRSHGHGQQHDSHAWPKLLACTPWRHRQPSPGSGHRIPRRSPSLHTRSNLEPHTVPAWRARRIVQPRRGSARAHKRHRTVPRRSAPAIPCLRHLLPAANSEGR